jgi:hypothetical protein
MTKRHDPGNDSDEAFEAFLRGEDALSAELQGIEQPAPSPELDARIRAQAREALEQPAGAANDAEEKALVSSPLGRWRAPLALAATVVIGVTLGLQWNGWRSPDPAPVSDVAMPPPPPEPAPPVAGLPEVAAPAAPSVPSAPAAQPKAEPRASAPAPAPVVDDSHAVVRGNATSESTGAPPPAPPAPPAPPPPAPASAAPAEVMAAPLPESPVLARSARAVLRPDQWLAQIAVQLDRSQEDDARASWRRFREAYPDYTVPAELQKRIDALPQP